MEKKLNVAVIGLGMGRSHAHAVEVNGHNLVALCEINEAAIERAIKEFNFPRNIIVDNWKSLVNREDIDAVIIATPDQQHREQCEAFLLAGKHVMCEKPLALNREDLEAIIKASKKTDKKFMVGQICRFTPSFIKAKQLIEEGVLGELYFIESEYAHDYAHLFADNPVDYWRSDPKRHGVVGGGCHAIDLLRWVAGNDPIEVFAYGTHKLLPCVPYDDATVALMKYPNDIMGKVFVSTGCKRNYTMRTVLYGTKGTIICDNGSDFLTLFKTDEKGDLVESKGEKIPVEINNHNTIKEFEVFADCIVNDKKVEMDGEEGARVVAICLAIVESSETGKIVIPNYEF